MKKLGHLLTAIFLICLFTSLSSNAANAGVPAFPGAEGGGANSVGGRGGRVIEVTNLNDSGPGSFRAACEAKGARTIVFRVGGTISIKDRIRITNPYITVAGQTAPGGGICIRNGEILIRTHDVIIRYLRIRPGKNTHDKDGIWVSDGSYNVIIDHCSLSWATDENLSIGSGYPAAHNITFSWNLIAEGLEPHSCGSLIYNSHGSLESVDISIHHNMYIHNHNRNPLIGTASARLINNIIYDWSQFAIRIFGGVHIDIIGNVIKPGPSTQKGTENQYSIWWSQSYGDPKQSVSGNPSIYLSNNYGIHQQNFAGDDWQMIAPHIKNHVSSLQKSKSLRLIPLSESTPPITINHIASVKELEEILLNEIGASKRLDAQGNWVYNRDPVDERLINEYLTGAGKIPTNENEVGGYPVLDHGIAPLDTDHDGMPDLWEKSHGLNPNNPFDGKLDADNDGYTNLEEYLNGNNIISESGILPPPTNIKIISVNF